MASLTALRVRGMVADSGAYASVGDEGDSNGPPVTPAGRTSLGEHATLLTHLPCYTNNLV